MNNPSDLCQLYQSFYRMQVASFLQADEPPAENLGVLPVLVFPLTFFAETNIVHGTVTRRLARHGMEKREKEK